MQNRVWAIAKESAGGFCGPARIQGDLVMIDCLDCVFLWFGLISKTRSVETVKNTECTLYYDKDAFYQAVAKVIK